MVEMSFLKESFISFKVFSGTYLWSAPSVIIGRDIGIMASLVYSTNTY